MPRPGRIELGLKTDKLPNGAKTHTLTIYAMQGTIMREKLYEVPLTDDDFTTLFTEGSLELVGKQFP